MKQSNAIQQEMQQIETIDMLAQTFKGISSHHISQLKNQVLQSKEFFADLWTIYTQLRSDPKDRSYREPVYPGRTAYIIVTAEGGLSGDIDKKVVETMLQQYDPDKQDVIVLGHHGVLQLSQTGTQIRKYYKIPNQDITQIDTNPIINDILEYENAVVFYQTYVTLGVQKIKHIDLFEAVHDLAVETGTTSERITAENYIFEPDFQQIVNYMESIMMGVALGQVILESKLAQYASRFNAMSAAHEKAKDIQQDLRTTYRRAKRAESDERTREVINGMRYGG